MCRFNLTGVGDSPVIFGDKMKRYILFIFLLSYFPLHSQNIHALYNTSNQTVFSYDNVHFDSTMFVNINYVLEQGGVINPDARISKHWHIENFINPMVQYSIAFIELENPLSVLYAGANLNCTINGVYMSADLLYYKSDFTDGWVLQLKMNEDFEHINVNFRLDFASSGYTFYPQIWLKVTDRFNAGVEWRKSNILNNYFSGGIKWNL